jgi:hypothetical protein
MHEDKCEDFMRTVNEYLRTFRDNASAGAGDTSGKRNVSFELDSDGFPILPRTSWNKISKENLEKIYRTYITTHYRRFIYPMPVLLNCSSALLGLASSNKNCQTPFTRIAEKQSDFIQSKYLPRGVSLNDPRGMKREEIIKIFDHIEGRQASHGVKDAFRFKCILSSRKKGSLCVSKYLYDEQVPGDKQAQAPEPALQSTPTTMERPDTSENPTPSPARDPHPAPPAPQSTPTTMERPDTSENPAPSPAQDPLLALRPRKKQKTRPDNSAQPAPGPDPQPPADEQMPATLPRPKPRMKQKEKGVQNTDPPAAEQIPIPAPGPDPQPPADEQMPATLPRPKPRMKQKGKGVQNPEPPAADQIPTPEATPMPTPEATPMPRPRPRMKQKGKSRAG